MYKGCAQSSMVTHFVFYKCLKPHKNECFCQARMKSFWNACLEYIKIHIHTTMFFSVTSDLESAGKRTQRRVRQTKSPHTGPPFVVI